MSVRTAAAELLAEQWADIAELADVRVIATERELDQLWHPTAILRSNTIAKAPQAPMSHRLVNLHLIIVSAHEDVDAAADQLDLVVSAALDHLDRLFLHDEAEAVKYGDRMAYRIPLPILASKEN